MHSRNPSPLRSSEPSDTRNSHLQDTGRETDWSLQKLDIPSDKKQLPPPSRPVPQLPLPSPRLSHDEKALFSPWGPSPLPSNFTHPASPRTNGVSLPSPQGTHRRSYREGLSAGAGVHSLQTSFTEFQGGLGPQSHSLRSLSQSELGVPATERPAAIPHPQPQQLNTAQQLVVLQNEPAMQGVVRVSLTRIHGTSAVSSGDAGVGITFGKIHASVGPYTIVAVTPNGPASKSQRVRAGDQLHAVDGVSVYNLNPQEVSGLIVGKQNTKIELLISSGSDSAYLLQGHHNHPQEQHQQQHMSSRDVKRGSESQRLHALTTESERSSSDSVVLEQGERAGGTERETEGETHEQQQPPPQSTHTVQQQAGVKYRHLPEYHEADHQQSSMQDTNENTIHQTHAFEHTHTFR